MTMELPRTFPARIPNVTVVGKRKRIISTYDESAMVPPLFLAESRRDIFLNNFLHDSFHQKNVITKKKKIKIQRIRMGDEVLASAKEYTQNTTLHGLRYVGADGLHMVERLFWIVAFACGILAAVYFITILYMRWDNTPMVTSISPTAIPLSSIPFPSITICNMNGAKKCVAQNIINSSESDTQNQFERYMLREVCGETMKSNFTSTVVDADSTQIKEFLTRVSQPCHEMMVSCKWRSKYLPCDDLFSTQLTDDGLCCTFNQVEKRFIYKHSKLSLQRNVSFSRTKIDWTPEKGYADDSSRNAYPWRAFGTGASMGLSIVLDAALHDYYCSSTASGGFKILLHNPIETPKISEFAFFLSPGFETRVEIWPMIGSSTSSLLSIPQDKRQCHLSSDRTLRYFRSYTQNNCELECQSNLTFHHCNCIPFYLPKDETTRICGTKDRKCVIRVKDIFNQRIKDEKSEKNFEFVENCSCYPGCVQVNYNKQMSAGKLQNSFAVRSNFLNGKSLNYYKRNMAVTHFFFLENRFTKFEKGEIFGFTDFLSNIGGLLGLFLGFSFMSAAEIIYFMSLKIFCSWYRKRKRLGKQNVNFSLRGRREKRRGSVGSSQFIKIITVN